MVEIEQKELEEFTGWRQPTESEVELLAPYLKLLKRGHYRFWRVCRVVSGFFALFMIGFSLPGNEPLDALMILYGLVPLGLMVMAFVEIKLDKQRLEKIERGSYDVLDCKCLSRIDGDYARIVTEDGRQSQGAYRFYYYGHQMRDMERYKDTPLLLVRITAYMAWKEEQEAYLFTYEILEWYKEKEEKKKRKKQKRNVD